MITFFCLNVLLAAVAVLACVKIQKDRKQTVTMLEAMQTASDTLLEIIRHETTEAGTVRDCHSAVIVYHREVNQLLARAERAALECTITEVTCEQLAEECKLYTDSVNLSRSECNHTFEECITLNLQAAASAQQAGNEATRAQETLAGCETIRLSVAESARLAKTNHR